MRSVILEAFRFLGSFGNQTGRSSTSNIRTKLGNMCGKTGQYNVPNELYQKRTARKNRCLISWKNVKKNQLTMEQLETFTGGVAVEFINEDFFAVENQDNPVFQELTRRIGSDKNVSSIISIRSESGSSSSAIQREYFEKLINNTEITYRDETIIINENNYQDYAIRQIESGGIGNDKWNGFLYISIRGGQQDTITTHANTELTIFNPACEYANPEVSNHIDLTMSYFALLSINASSLTKDQKSTYNSLKKRIEEELSKTRYDNITFKGSLLDYCQNHPSVKMNPGNLYDPIQVKPIEIGHFNINDKNDDNYLNFTHDEAVFFEKYYWDHKQQCILSAARPTNLFWSLHLSNMMQQNFTLEEYFQHEEAIVERRKTLLNR